MFTCQSCMSLISLPLAPSIPIPIPVPVPFPFHPSFCSSIERTTEPLSLFWKKNRWTSKSCYLLYDQINHRFFFSWGCTLYTISLSLFICWPKLHANLVLKNLQENWTDLFDHIRIKSLPVDVWSPSYAAKQIFEMNKNPFAEQDQRIHSLHRTIKSILDSFSFFHVLHEEGGDANFRKLLKFCSFFLIKKLHFFFD